MCKPKTGALKKPFWSAEFSKMEVFTKHSSWPMKKFRKLNLTPLELRRLKNYTRQLLIGPEKKSSLVFYAI